MGFRLSCINHIDLIDPFVAIPVVIRIVDQRIGELQGFDNHFCCAVIQAVVRCSTIIGACLGNREWSNHIEVNVQQAIALLEEIIAHGTDMVVERKTLLVETVPPLSGCIVLQLHVGKLDEQDKPPLCLGLCLCTQWPMLMTECYIGLTHLLQTRQAALVNAWETLRVVIAVGWNGSYQWLGTNEETTKECYKKSRQFLIHIHLFRIEG